MAQSLNISPEQDANLRFDIDRSTRIPVLFFFGSGTVWLLISIILGLISSIQSVYPDCLSCIPGLHYGRVFAAHWDAFIYGWAAQAAFGVLIWLMARLSRQACQCPILITVAGLVWNAAVSFGIVWILVFGSSGQPWMQMPANVYPILILAYALIGIGSFINFRTRLGGHVYISQWYILAALFWFPWVLGSCHVFVNFYEGGGLVAAGINAWYRSAILFLFFTPIAIASAYYLAPKVTGRPVYSYSLGLLGFWVLAVVGPWSGIEKLFGAPYATFLQHAGAAASIAFLIPAAAVAYNVAMTLKNHQSIASKSPSLLFTGAGVFGLLLFAIINLLHHLPFALPYTNFTVGKYGNDLLAVYGFFSLCMFGAMYFIIPRLTSREWVSTTAIKWHFYSSLYGILFIAGFCALLGPFMHGLELDSLKSTSYSISGKVYAYNWSYIIGWAFILLANVIFFAHLALMLLFLGRRSSHPTLLHAHEAHSPHGSEGEISIGNA